MISTSEISRTKPHNGTAGWFWQNRLWNYNLFGLSRFEGCSVWLSSISSMNEKTSGNSAKKSVSMLFTALEMLRVSGGRSDQSILSNNVLSQHNATQRWNRHGPWLHGSKAQDTIWLSMKCDVVLTPNGSKENFLENKALFSKNNCMSAWLGSSAWMPTNYQPGMDGMMPQCHSATVSVSTLVRAQKNNDTEVHKSCTLWTACSNCGFLPRPFWRTSKQWVPIWSLQRDRN